MNNTELVCYVLNELNCLDPKGLKIYKDESYTVIEVNNRKYYLVGGFTIEAFLNAHAYFKADTLVKNGHFKNES